MYQGVASLKMHKRRSTVKDYAASVKNPAYSGILVYDITVV
jgi:hypothetical protein